MTTIRKLRVFAASAILAACALPQWSGAETVVELGKLQKASFRIDIPEGWNGILVMYCHGYETGPVVFNVKDALMPALQRLVLAKYAVAQSGYSSGGWAVEAAVKDTEALRKYFIKRHRRPKETYAVGLSLGGFLILELVEQFGNAYDGGLALCGPLAPANWFLARRVFDLLVLFDVYFPGALPSPDRIPKNYAPAPDKLQAIQKLLDENPDKSASLRKFADNHTNEELASNLVFFAYILQDLQEHANGNPFDNRGIVYDQIAGDESVNDKVGRYKAGSMAASYLVKYYTPTGAIRRPILGLRTTYDPLIPAWVSNEYASLVEASGSERFFVQQYVDHDGHCAMTDAEIARAFTELVSWKRSGQAPQPGKLPPG